MLKRSKIEAVYRANQFVEEKYNYIYGYKDAYNPVTLSRINQLARDNPSVFTSSYIEKVKKFIGQKAIDCSGLICNALGISDIGSYNIAELPQKQASNFKSVDLVNRQQGDIVWKQGHVGFVVDYAIVIEARSLSAGVKQFSYASQPWTKCIRPNYNEIAGEYAMTGWIRDNKGWWYAYDKKVGSYYRNGIAEIGGQMYVFDKEGYCLDNPQILTDKSGAVIEIRGNRL